MVRKIATILLFPILFLHYNYNIFCKTYTGYLFPFFSSDCFYDPDINDDISTIVQRHIGVFEAHQVQTQDGYILQLFRIPRRNPKGVILFQHPMLTDSKIWVAQNNDSVAFLFWRAGYDVWLGNSRGTFYSKKHVTLSPKSAQFWNFSFHEMGYYDIDNTIDYIKGATNGSSIIYIGNCMGTNSGLVYGVTKPEKAKSIKIMVAISPSVHVERFRSPLYTPVLTLLDFQPYAEYINFFLPFGGYDSWSLKLVRTCHFLFPLKKVTAYILSYIYGWTPEEFDPTLLNMFVMKLGGETPVKLLHHYNQCFKAKKFQMYDYGETGNLEMYKDKKPLLYDFRKVKFPIYVVYGLNDTVISPEDCEAFHNLLPEESKIYGKLAVNNLNHIGIFLNKNRNQVFNKIIQLLDKI